MKTRQYQTNEDLNIISDMNAKLSQLNTDGVDVGRISDGYHTFNELYDHRAKLFAVIVAVFPKVSWKSKKHSGGDMFNDMFIVGITTPEGNYSYHYNMKYWDMFICKELDNAPAYDGHKPSDINRLFGLL